MQAIKTSRYGTHRIRARCEAGSLVLTRDDALNSEEQHRQAALHLAQKLKWLGTFHGGTLPGVADMAWVKSYDDLASASFAVYNYDSAPGGTPLLGTPSPRSLEPLSRYRYVLRVKPRLGSTSPGDRDRGSALRAIRSACGLTESDVASGWGVQPATIGAVEDGDLVFPSAQDFRAACHQLWLWGSERGVR